MYVRICILNEIRCNIKYYNKKKKENEKKSRHKAKIEKHQ